MTFCAVITVCVTNEVASWQCNEVYRHLFDVQSEVDKWRIRRDNPLYSILVTMATGWLTGEL